MSIACSDPVLQKEALGHGYTLRVRARNSWEVNRPIYCEVEGPGIKDRRYCDADLGEGGPGEAKPGHYAILGKPGTIVGLVRRSEPNTVLLLVDLSTGRIWPPAVADPHPIDGGPLLDRLQTSTANTHLVLGNR